MSACRVLGARDSQFARAAAVARAARVNQSWPTQAPAGICGLAPRRVPSRPGAPSVTSLAAASAVAERTPPGAARECAARRHAPIHASAAGPIVRGDVGLDRGDVGGSADSPRTAEWTARMHQRAVRVARAAARLAQRGVDSGAPRFTVGRWCRRRSRCRRWRRSCRWRASLGLRRG